MKNLGIIICITTGIFFIPSCRILNRKDRNTKWATAVKNPRLSNFYQVSDSLYRSAQPGREDFNEITAYGIKSVLNLRHDRSDSLSAGVNRLKIYRVPVITASFSDAEMIEALRIIRNAPKPLLVHCRHGADRTGTVMALYRIIFQNWSKEEAIAEMKKGGYRFHRRYKNIPAYISGVDTTRLRKMIFDD
jgi:tyrosine-protein phosphatase SIW14